MIKRNHPLTIGEQVYDCDTQYIYHITAFNPDGTIELAMWDWDLRENLIMFDCEITEDEYERTSDNPDALYQFVPGLVDRSDNPICYEHDTEVGWCGEEHNEGEAYYPYFAPYLQENLFEFETYPVGN